MNDQRVMDVAKYKCSNGMLTRPTQEALEKEFAAMKKRILAGRTTVSKLEETVFTKYGVQEELKIPMQSGQMGFPPGMIGPGEPEGHGKHKEIEGFGSK